MPDKYHKNWTLICEEDEKKIRAMIDLLDNFEKENIKLEKQLEKVKKTGYDNNYDYYYPCGGGSLI